jgi:hypothetical protein
VWKNSLDLNGKWEIHKAQPASLPLQNIISHRGAVFVELAKRKEEGYILCYFLWSLLFVGRRGNNLEGMENVGFMCVFLYVDIHHVLGGLNHTSFL